MPLKAKCKECGADIEIPDDALPGEIVSCPDCGLEDIGEDWGE